MKTENLTFGEALEALQNGQRVCREGWNGKGMYLYLQEGSQVWKDDLKEESPMKKHVSEADGSDTILIHSHIDMKTADGSVSVGWRPTNVDMFTNDWQIHMFKV